MLFLWLTEVDKIIWLIHSIDADGEDAYSMRLTMK